MSYAPYQGQPAGGYAPPPGQPPYGQPQYSGQPGQPQYGPPPTQGQYQQPQPAAQGQNQAYYGQAPQPQYGAPGPPPQQQPQYGGYQAPPGPPPGSGYYPPPANQYQGYSQEQPQYQAPPQPPPQELYGSPAHPAYSPQPSPGAAPQYGSPAGAPPYGQPQPQYGHPAQGAAPGYPPPAAAPSYPPQTRTAPTAPSLGYGAPQMIQWDANPDSQACRDAMKGFGTNEKLLIRTLASKDPLQVDSIRATFQRLFARDLIKDIQKETSGDLEYGLVSLARGPLQNDVHELYNAIAGPGTSEKVLNDVLLGRSNADINAIKGAYQRTYNRRLEDHVKGDLSGKTERHFMIVLGAARDEDSEPVDPRRVDNDVQEIYRATEGRLGTDEVSVSSILSTRNDAHIRAIAATYPKRYSGSLDRVIKKEFSGHLEDALLFQLGHAQDRCMHAADLLEDAMAGLGTKEKLLAARVVRFHWDRAFMSSVRSAYSRKYGKDLAKRIKSETSGEFEKFLLACIGEPV